MIYDIRIPHYPDLKLQLDITKNIESYCLTLTGNNTPKELKNTRSICRWIKNDCHIKIHSNNFPEIFLPSYSELDLFIGGLDENKKSWATSLYIPKNNRTNKLIKTINSIFKSLTLNNSKFKLL